MDSAPNSAPVDRHKIVYIIFVWLGVGTLLPWNFFITQNSYWNHRYRDLECQVCSILGLYQSGMYCAKSFDTIENITLIILTLD